MGLFQDANETQHALADAKADFASPHQLRFLFCQLLLNFPTNAIVPFDNYQEELMADYIDQFSSAEIAADFAL